MRRLSSWIKFHPRSRSRPRLRFPFALAILLLWATPSTIFAATFTATLDRETVTVGETATLTLKLEGGEIDAMPSPPQQANLQVAPGLPLQWQQNINGQRSSGLSQTFGLIPTQPGEFNIPALKAEVGGQVLTTQPLKLTAVKGSSPAVDATGEKLAFFKLVVPKKEVYVGEILAVQFQVYIRDGLANADQILQYFNQLGSCPLKAEGFSIIKTARPQFQRAQAGNATYVVATFVTSLSPVKTGPLSIVSMDMTLPLQIPLPNQRRRDRFDPFGMA